jgi:hypothetical protein
MAMVTNDRRALFAHSERPRVFLPAIHDAPPKKALSFADARPALTSALR